MIRSKFLVKSKLFTKLISGLGFLISRVRLVFTKLK